jgi:hypothetical protein
LREKVKSLSHSQQKSACPTTLSCVSQRSKVLINTSYLGMVILIVIPVLGRLRQEDCEFQPSYIEGHCLKKPIIMIKIIIIKKMISEPG